MIKSKKSQPILSVLGLLFANTIFAADSTQTRYGAEFVGDTVTPAVVTVNLKNLPAPTQWKPGDPIKEIPLKFNRPKDWVRPQPAGRGFGFDALAQKQVDAASTFGTDPFDNLLYNLDGAGFTGVNPSDTNGDVGINYYVQTINNSSSSIILIIDKSDGSTAAQFVMDTIANGSGTGCGGGRGDPVVLFDQFADNGPGEPKGRWVFTEFTSNSFCMYISKTHDPLGQSSSTWYIYEFTSASGGLPDYPKFGVWGDAYYAGANESNRQYAFDRDNMLLGNPARGYQVFTSPGLPGFGFQHMMPADADGETLPPQGAPGIFMRHRDGEYHGDNPPDDVLELWEFTTDFDTPANSAITGPINIHVSEFDTHLGGSNFGDLSVPQPNGATNLFPLKQPLMWRVQHRTIDDKQYLVGNMVTDVDGNDYHGVRWWQLERPAASTNGNDWVLKDEGTYTLNDGVHRWMASAAMDGDGNIAIGYNTSSSSVFPGMRYAGRLTDDPAGTMPRGENSIIEGSGSNSSGRYGDYSSLNVDPVDECTFWYTAQYNASSNWSTRIGAFKFEQCGCQLSLDTINVTGATVPNDNQIDVSWDDSATPEMIEYRIYRSTTMGTGYVLIDTVADTSPGTGSTGSYTYNDTTVSGGTVYYYIVKASDGGACLTSNSNEVNATATGLCTLAPTFAGITSASNNATQSCSITLNWDTANSQCPNSVGELNYSVYRSTTSGFTPSLANQIATGVNTNTFLDNIGGLTSDVDYFYVVRSYDTDNSVEDSNITENSAFPTGPITPQPFDDNLESYTTIADAEAAGWSHNAATGADDWRIEIGDDHTNGTGAAFVSTDVSSSSDKSIITREFSPSATSVLSFYHKYNFETSYDGGVLEITVDGGANWTDLESNMTTGSYDVTLNGGFGQPLGARRAWNGQQASFTLIEVDLSPYQAQVAQIRWRMGTDQSVGGGDWKIDDIVITNSGSFGTCDVPVDLIFMDGFEGSPPPP